MKKRDQMSDNEHTELYRSTDGGWTFIETLIVIGIILILTSSVGFMAVKYLDKAKVVTAKSQIDTFALALNAYFLDCNDYPSSEQGLTALYSKPSTEPVSENWNGPYINKSIPKDPWGNDYKYVIPAENGIPFGIESLGADGKEGGLGNDADITSWQ